MADQPLADTVFTAWQIVASCVANSRAEEFTGQDKETSVLRCLNKEIVKLDPTLELIGPEMQERFETWRIDLVCSRGIERIAIEGKFKVLTDGAVPDNRKAAFFDLYKLEHYISGGNYSSMPLPLTLNGRYAFNWRKVMPSKDWHALILEVG